MGGILTLTMNPVIDKSCTTESVVANRKLRCSEPSHEPGGGGLNVSKAIQELGGNSVAAYPAGGPTGEQLQHMLAQINIEQRVQHIRAWTRQNLIVIENSSGQQFRFGMPGAALNEDDWQRLLQIVEQEDRPDYIVASGSLPPGVPEEFYAKLARITQNMKVRLILDTSGRPLQQALQESVFLIKPNIRELGEIVGARIKSEEEQENAAKELIQKGHCQHVVLSLGAAGVLFVTANHSERIRSPSVEVKSRVGAGDSTVAGIVLALSQGKDLPEAVRFGVAAGAAAVMTEGTQLCRREDTERLYKSLSST